MKDYPKTRSWLFIQINKGYIAADAKKLLENYFYAEGYLKRKHSEEYEKYMEKPPLWEYLHYGAAMISELAKRMIAGGRGD